MYRILFAYAGVSLIACTCECAAQTNVDEIREFWAETAIGEVTCVVQGVRTNWQLDESESNKLSLGTATKESFQGYFRYNSSLGICAKDAAVECNELGEEGIYFSNFTS